MASELLLIHYNDVYNVEPLATKGPKDLAAGANKFAGKLKSFQADNPLVLFSGDAFNPSSSESTARPAGSKMKGPQASAESVAGAGGKPARCLWPGQYRESRLVFSPPLPTSDRRSAPPTRPSCSEHRHQGQAHGSGP